MSEILGRNLRRYIRRGHQPPPETLLDGLEKLWGVPVQQADTRPFNLAGAYRRAMRAFVKALENDPGGQAILMDATRSLDPFAKAWTPTHTAQNDFYDDQMLILPDGRISLVDFEETGPGDPMLDVGNFLAHLRYTTHFGKPRESRAKAAYHSIFLTASLDRLRWNSLDLALREAVCLFRVWHQHHPPPPSRLARPPQARPLPRQRHPRIIDASQTCTHSASSGCHPLSVSCRHPERSEGSKIVVAKQGLLRARPFRFLAPLEMTETTKSLASVQVL